MSRIPLTLLAILIVVATRPAGAEPTAEERAAGQFFETKVRPVLIEHCYRCHGAGKHKGGLELDSRGGLIRGGDSGPAIVPGDPAASLLLQAVSYADDAPTQMPPAGKLPDHVIANLTQWVREGAVWPGSDNDSAPPAKRHSAEVTEADRDYWAFRPVVRPQTANAAGRHAIDLLLEQRMTSRGIQPNPLATRRELIRRVYFDLIGLPPSPEAVAAFERNESPQAWEQLIDDLLARPEFGERWGRHWLDVVRFAQTNGYERDGEKANSWRYRDYVIRSFNEDKPYDQFVREQLAGDLEQPLTNDGLVATGFYRLGVWDDEPDDRQMAEFDQLDDILATTGATFLGLTLGCARCHDHMFDPIPQKEYYSLLAYIRNIRLHANEIDLDSASQAPIGDRNQIAAWEADVRNRLNTLRAERDAAKPEERKEFDKSIRELLSQAPEGVGWALCVKERAAPLPTHILTRGNANTPADAVDPSFLSVLPPITNTVGEDDNIPDRLRFARWVASRDNPLTSRVFVNRLWQHLFGVPIVKTTTDFGKAGVAPTQPEVLDWLAAELIDQNWSTKKLIRSILVSEAYRRSSRIDLKGTSAQLDPANDLFWRQNLRRLEAEAIHDSMLAVSGNLNPERGGRGFFPRLAGEVMAGGSRPGDGWALMEGPSQWRRAVYTFIKRSMMAPGLEVFDYANNAAPLGERPTTTVAPQALMLLNDRFVHEQARALRTRIEREAGTDIEAQTRHAYRLALGRDPTADELAIAREFVDQRTQSWIPLRSRLTFVPDVPLSLHNSYAVQLQPEDYLIGPGHGWQYFRGAWLGGYEGIKSVDPNQMPFALWPGVSLLDGQLTTRLVLSSATESASLLWRGSSKDQLYRGYELVVRPRESRVDLIRHADQPENLASHPLVVSARTPLEVTITFSGDRHSVQIAGTSNLEFTLQDSAPGKIEQAGFVGVRAWGAAVSLDSPRLSSSDQHWDIASLAIDASASPRKPGELAGWTTWDGDWTTTNDGTLRTQPSSGGKIVANDLSFTDGIVEAELRITSGADIGLLIRASDLRMGTDSLRAYNINLRSDSLRLGRHDQNWSVLGSAPLQTSPEQWRHLRVEVTGPRLRVFVDHSETPLLDVTDPAPLPPGSIGARTFRAAGEFRNFRVVAAAGEERKLDFPPTSNASPDLTVAAWHPHDPRPNPRDQAMVDLCLAILNLNEFLYID
ncbi:MAG: DUF1553 domain-containing protein [Planctomycetaceae bacterium]|nr:DUF1553 domain-containing protein [Planctomycetaceae bacterium]